MTYRLALSLLAACGTALAIGSSAVLSEAPATTADPGTPRTSYAVARPPVKLLETGERVVTAVSDVGGLTGPFEIRDAAPGDLLVVTLHRLTPTRHSGTTTVPLSRRVIADASVLAANTDASQIPWTLDPARGVVSFRLKDVGAATPWGERFTSPVVELPLQPGLGAIGVAPGGGGSAVAASAGPFGGRLDVPGLSAGARVLLPVLEPGGWLYLGEGYARVGEGAITGSGIGIPLEVEFSVELVKKKEWPHSSVVRPSTVVGEFEQDWPRVETSDAVMTVGSGGTLDEAFQRATLEMHHWLDDDFGFSEKLVNVFVGQAIQYRIARVDGERAVVVASVRRADLPVPKP